MDWGLTTRLRRATPANQVRIVCLLAVLTLTATSCGQTPVTTPAVAASGRFLVIPNVVPPLGRSREEPRRLQGHHHGVPSGQGAPMKRALGGNESGETRWLRELRVEEAALASAHESARDSSTVAAARVVPRGYSG